METKLSSDQICVIPANVVLNGRPLFSLTISREGMYIILLFIGGRDPGIMGTLGVSSPSFVIVL